MLCEPKPLIYLASPYSHVGPPEENPGIWESMTGYMVKQVESKRYEQACQATARLLGRGHLILSPIAHSHGPAVLGVMGGDFKTWLELDSRLVDVCNEVWVLMLDGWRQSKGVAVEIEWARNQRKPVVYLDPIDLLPTKAVDHCAVCALPLFAGDKMNTWTAVGGLARTCEVCGGPDDLKAFGLSRPSEGGDA